MGMPYKSDSPAAEVARIAARQHGAVTAKQLAAAGLGRMAISELTKKGRLHRGVYAVGHRGSVAFEDDHARDLDLRAAGYTVLRFIDRQLEEEPGRVVADVARALEQEDW